VRVSLRPALTGQAALLFLVCLLPILLLVGGLNYEYTRQALEAQSRLDTGARTTTVEQTLANVLLRELERLSSLTNDVRLVGPVARPPGATLVGAQQAYEEAGATSPARVTYVNTPAAQALRAFREEFPHRSVVLLADVDGRLEATTTPAWPYWNLAGQPWWPDLSRGAASALNIGQPVTVPGLGTLLFLAVPILDSGQRPVAVVVVGLNFVPLAKAVLQDNAQAATVTLLTTQQGQILYAVPDWPAPQLPPDWRTAYTAIGSDTAILSASVTPSTTVATALPLGAPSTSYLVGYVPLRQIEGYGLDDPASIRALNRLNWMVLRITPTTVAFAAQGQQLTLLALGTVLTAVVVVVMALVVVRTLVTLPLRQIELAMDAVREHGLAPAAAARSQARLPQGRNEIGRLAQTFGEMLRYLSRLMQEREQFYARQATTVEQLRALAARLSSTATEQQHATASTSAVLRQVLEAFGALDAAAVAIAEYAQQVATQAQELQTQHGAGDTAVVGTQQALTDLQGTAQALETSAQILADNASAASALIDEANTIAATTHLLSLNAFIEAAGAGPYGARFGVIAQEVRALATEAAGTADSINAELIRMADQNRHTATMTAQARQAVDSGAIQVQVLVGMTQALLEAADNLAANADHIRQQSAEQRTHSRAVRLSSNQLASAMAQVTLASQDVAAQAQVLFDLAQTLDLTQAPQATDPQFGAAVPPPPTAAPQEAEPWQSSVALSQREARVR
jgi:methyl-accepting chemotaxis protein